MFCAWKVALGRQHQDLGDFPPPWKQMEKGQAVQEPMALAAFTPCVCTVTGVVTEEGPRMPGDS